MNLKAQVANAAFPSWLLPGSSGAGGRFPLDAVLLEPVIPADVGGNSGSCWLEMGWFPAAVRTSRRAQDGW